MLYKDNNNNYDNTLLAVKTIEKKNVNRHVMKWSGSLGQGNLIRTFRFPYILFYYEEVFIIIYSCINRP